MNFDDYQPEETCQIPGLAGIYAGVFGLKNDGVFVEVGAYDGKTYSNTYHLAKLGWRGLYIEPDPVAASKCEWNHKDSQNIKVEWKFASDHEGVVDIHKTDAMTTGNDDFIKNFITGNSNMFTASMMTLDKILLDANIPFYFDLLVIDVEGNELQVLAGFDIMEWAPKMIIIETHAYAEDERLSIHAKDIHKFMDEHWYQRIYADTINSIYVPTLSEAI